MIPYSHECQGKPRKVRSLHHANPPPRRLPKRPRPPSTRGAKAKLISSKLAFKGKVFNVYTDTLIEPGGHRNTRDVIRHNGSVVILAVDESKNPADPDIILERQYRYAAGQELIELPAGSRNAGEAPLAAAKREMIEETGFRAKKWTVLLQVLRQPRLPRRMDADLSCARPARRAVGA